MGRIEAASVSRLARSCFIVILILPPPLDAQSIAAGTTIRVKLDHAVTTKSANLDDPVTAVISQPLKNGIEVVVPAGSVLHGRVAFVQHGSPTNDGWMRLLFNRFELPDGRNMNTLASGVFALKQQNSARDYPLAVGGLATIGAIVAGRTRRVVAGLGGAIAGFLIVENTHGPGRDVTLRQGKTIPLRLNNDLSR